MPVIAAAESSTAEVWTAVFTGLLVLGVIYAARQVTVTASQLSEQRKARQSDLIDKLHSRWAELKVARKTAHESTSSELADRMKVALDPFDFDAYYELTSLPSFFETVGHHVTEGTLEFDVLERAVGIALRSAWKKWEPAVSVLRDHYRSELADEADEIYREFQALAEREGGEG